MSPKKPLDVLYNEKGQPLCSRLNQQCRNCIDPDTGRHTSFKGMPSGTLVCPNCGEDRRCRNVVSEPGAACVQRHGGKTPKGIANPNTKHGRYSKHLPPNLLERYEAALADPALTAHTDEIALIDARLAQLIERIQASDAGSSYFYKVHNTWLELQAAMATGNADATMKAMSAHEGAVLAGYADAILWDDIGEWVERRRKLAESQQKHQQVERQMVTLDEFMLFGMAMLQVAKDVIDDRRKLTKFADAMQNLLTRSNMPSLVDGTANEIE